MAKRLACDNFANCPRCTLGSHTKAPMLFPPLNGTWRRGRRSTALRISSRLLVQVNHLITSHLSLVSRSCGLALADW